jgi:hypothetical protein
LRADKNIMDFSFCAFNLYKGLTTNYVTLKDALLDPFPLVTLMQCIFRKKIYMDRHARLTHLERDKICEQSLSLSECRKGVRKTFNIVQ